MRSLLFAGKHPLNISRSLTAYLQTLFVVCLLFAATVSVGADDEECKCVKVATGSWDITFGEDDDVPFSKEGRMELKHDFDELYHG